MARLGENVTAIASEATQSSGTLGPRRLPDAASHGGFPTPDGSRRDVEPESVMRRPEAPVLTCRPRRRADNRVSVQTTRSLDLSRLSVEELEVFERALQKSLAR